MLSIRHHKVQLATLCLSIVPLAACATGNNGSAGGADSIPDTGVSIEVSLSKGVQIKDARGKELEECRAPCEVAAKEYGKQCSDVDMRLPVCKGLTDVSVSDVNTITIIESKKNPYCYTYVIGKKFTQVCYPQ